MNEEDLSFENTFGIVNGNGKELQYLSFITLIFLYYLEIVRKDDPEIDSTFH
jgi:hypothetical protein